MKVVHWNVSRNNEPMTGIKRYEDELYRHIKEIGEDIEMERIQRNKNVIAGNVISSWFWAYKSVGADIVHATSPQIAPVAFINKPKRFIVTVHDLIPLVFPSELGKDPSKRIQWFLTPKALKKADRIITISEFSKGEVSSLLGIDKSKIYVTLLAVDRTKYLPKDKLECREKFNLKEEGKYILVVASNLEHKRMDIVKEVFNSTREKRKDINLIKAGYAQELSGEGIMNIGYVSEEDMPDLYNSANVFLNTSEYEGFCLPVLEAMSCGIPVVASNKASIPEVVGHSGNLVDIDDNDAVEKFVDKILSCIDMGVDEKALEQSSKFSWEKTAEETIKIYRSIYEPLG